MKTILSAALFLLTAQAFAQATFTVRTRVVKRDSDFEARIRTVNLENLLGRDRVEGVHFKVVNGKSNDAISFSDDPELVLRAATTYYHLSKARDFFASQLGSSFVSAMPQMIIRVNLTNQYNDLGHFAHDNLEPQYNNALTIPAGVGFAGRVQPWGSEIWFRPMRRTHIRDLNVRDPGMGSWGALLSQFREQNRMSTMQRFVGQLVQSATNENAPAIGWESVLRTGGTVLMLELIVANAEPLSRLFSRKIFWLDTALVPEIIYHEYAHVALSDKLVLSHSTAVIEGMADFFAGRIANSDRLALDIGDYNTFNGKRATRNEQYQVEFETTDFANSDFVFGMLWDLKEIVGEERVNEFVYRLRNRLETSHTIRRQLIEGILRTCDEMCESPFIDKLRILRRYQARGL